MLILAATALAEVTAPGRDPLRRRLQNTQQPRPRKLLLDLDDFDFDLLAYQHEGDKHNEIIRPRHALAAKRDVVNRDGEFAAGAERLSPLRRIRHRGKYRHAKRRRSGTELNTDCSRNHFECGT